MTLFRQHWADVAALSRITAVVITFSTMAFLAREVISPGTLTYPLFSLLFIGAMGLLVRLSLLPANRGLWSRSQLFYIRAHVYLHLVPFSYMALQLETAPSLRVNTLYYVPVVLFFFTGRRTWQAFYQAFGSKVYKLFYLGNTGMIVGHTLLLGFGLLFKEAIGAEFFEKLFMLYFSVHLLILGAAVVKIEHDINGADVVE